MDLHYLCDSCCEVGWRGRPNDLTGGWICTECDEEQLETDSERATTETAE
jgi:hypothetical protein